MTDPIDVFLTWFDGLTYGQQVDLAVYLEQSLTPAGQPANLDDVGKHSVRRYLREPPPSPLQTVTRLGVMRSLVDHLCVPIVSQALQAYGTAHLAILKGRSQAAGNDSAAQLAERALEQSKTYVDDNAHMFSTWDDLAHAKGGALTSEALYEWMFLTTRNLKTDASPFIGGEN